jgi:hypothetical protein
VCALFETNDWTKPVGVGLMIEHCIQPSYRNELYRVKVALTRESPISCFCDCKEGAEIDARHACVHMAPTIYLLNLFLFDGLADNLLYELSARWKAADDDSLSETEQKDMVLAVTTSPPKHSTAISKLQAGVANQKRKGEKVFHEGARSGSINESNFRHTEPSESVNNGSLSALTNAGFPRNRHSDTLLNICGQVGLPRRLSLGEGLACESHSHQKRFDLFIHGQDLFHLFLNDTGYEVQLKRFSSQMWEPMLAINLDVLRSEDCA